ncbi:MAG TPA: hypothetical protein DDY78_17250 [Planctomycetales bacterium]|jgi:serine/threonine protein kinase|nr:hypothetical protein [Planctomycetales bacterium]
MTERELFVAALHLRDAARVAFLDLACDDRAVRSRVESLLLDHERLGGFLEPSAAPGEAAPDPNATTDLPGEHLDTVIAGKYKLIELIGEGGMGSVWRAQLTEPVKRFVAVKLIKSGMDSKAVLARFEAERQALAVMDHPNIARILDGGVTEAGSPFFVMELVKGVPITEFCDARKLTPKQRLELFVPVCQAIQHAHQKGVIHRDIKPSNVLIALYDDKAVPKVIDFGIAKATGQALTDSSYQTAFGGVVGTPEYMSPEQASLNNLDIDTRSDVYSLGVLLYELLAGSPPFRSADLKKAGMLEMLRVVREEEPPRPSTRLSTANTLPSISANRGTEPKKLTGLLRNELDWIVMKALEKDRARRYESANGFAADVQRHLAGEAVQAHPPSARYRMWKLIRRHKGRVLAASLLFAALVAGLASTTWQAIRATAAEREARKAQGLADLDRDRALKAEAQAKADRDKAEDESKHLRQTECYYYGSRAMEMGDYDSAEKLFVESLGLARSRRGLGDVETQMIVWPLANLYAQTKRPEKGEALLRESLDFQKEHGQADSLPLPYAFTLEPLGRNLLQQRKWAAAEAVLRECLSIRENKTPAMYYTVVTKSLLGASLVGQNKYADAEPYLLKGYQGLKDTAGVPVLGEGPGIGRILVPEAAERLVQLYEATGEKDKADEWRKKLKEAKDAGKPALTP